jgi:hypothetical protein
VRSLHAAGNASLRYLEAQHHVIALNERHLKRLLSEYVLYYHEDRTHLGLGKDLFSQLLFINRRSKKVPSAHE